MRLWGRMDTCLRDRSLIIRRGRGGLQNRRGAYSSCTPTNSGAGEWEKVLTIMEGQGTKLVEVFICLL